LSTPLFKDSCPNFRTAIGSVSRVKTIIGTVAAFGLF